MDIETKLIYEIYCEHFGLINESKFRKILNALKEEYGKRRGFYNLIAVLFMGASIFGKAERKVLTDTAADAIEKANFVSSYYKDDASFEKKFREIDERQFKNQIIDLHNLIQVMIRLIKDSDEYKNNPDLKEMLDEHHRYQQQFLKEDLEGFEKMKWDSDNQKQEMKKKLLYPQTYNPWKTQFDIEEYLSNRELQRTDPEFYKRYMKNMKTKNEEEESFSLQLPKILSQFGYNDNEVAKMTSGIN